MSSVIQSPSRLLGYVWKGAVAGLGGGVVFGILRAMTGMLPMVAMLAGSENAAVGGAVHMVISAGIGLVFGVIAGSFAGRPAPVLGAGAVYGLLWWVLGPLLLMPAMLGMPLFMVDRTAMMSLVGHVLYGLVTAVLLYLLSRSRA